MSEDATYWLCTDPVDGAVKLFCFQSGVHGSGVLPSFSRPVAQLCVRAGVRLLSKRYNGPVRGRREEDGDIDTFDPHLCTHLFHRAAQLLTQRDDVALWAFVQSRLASLCLEGHAFPLSPKVGYVCASDPRCVQQWMEVSPPCGVGGSVGPLLDEEQVGVDAITRALPGLLHCIHSIRAWVHHRLVHGGESCDTIDPDVCKLEGEARSTVCHCFLTLAKDAVCEGRYGRALRLCGYAHAGASAALLPSGQRGWDSECVTFGQVVCEARAVVGKVFVEMGAVGRASPAVFSAWVQGVYDDMHTNERDDGDSKWLGCNEETLFTFTPVTLPLHPAVHAKLSTACQCACWECVCPPALDPGSPCATLCALPGFTTPLPTVVDDVWNAAVQACVPVLRQGPDTAMPGLWMAHAVEWVNEAFGALGDSLLASGRVTKAAQVCGCVCVCLCACVCVCVCGCGCVRA